MIFRIIKLTLGISIFIAICYLIGITIGKDMVDGDSFVLYFISGFILFFPLIGLLYGITGVILLLIVFPIINYIAGKHIVGDNGEF